MLINASGVTKQAYYSTNTNTYGFYTKRKEDSSDEWITKKVSSEVSNYIWILGIYDMKCGQNQEDH